MDNLISVEKYNLNSELFNYFSYDYFYVVCVIFNELDSDENGLIDWNEFEHFTRHSLSSLVLDRIFSEFGILSKKIVDNN